MNANNMKTQLFCFMKSDLKGPFFGPFIGTISYGPRIGTKRWSLIMGPYFGPFIGTIVTVTVCVGNRLNKGLTEHLYCDEITRQVSTIPYEIHMCVHIFRPVKCTYTVYCL